MKRSTQARGRRTAHVPPAGGEKYEILLPLATVICRGKRERAGLARSFASHDKNLLKRGLCQQRTPVKSVLCCGLSAHLFVNVVFLSGLKVHLVIREELNPDTRLTAQ